MGSNLQEVVISGIGGKFPDCLNIEEFKEKLFSGTNLLKSDFKRWNPAKEEKPFTSGVIPEWNKFDITFFGVPSTLARNCDPMMGLMLERSLEAMIDAGVNPTLMRGKKVSVISATSISDAEILRATIDIFEGLGMVGHSRTMMANRISYCFNFTGPSYSCDCSWTSAVQALEIAAKQVAQGTVEAAIVTTCSLLLYNSIDVEYQILNILSPNGKCSPFDAEGNGFSRSESTSAFFIQRAADAKRHYCTLLGAQTRCIGDKPCNYVQHSPRIDLFLKNFYTDFQFNPADVSYVETASLCIQDTDVKELNAMEKVFCAQRSSPLLIGSLFGNMGNSEGASGFAALIKVIMALETGLIPPTLNYCTPHPLVPSLINGKLKPVTQTTEMCGDIAAVSCMNFSGNMSHILVKGHHRKSKIVLATGELPPDGLPRLVTFQARHEHGARSITDKLSSMPVDTEFVAMVNDLFQIPISAYLWRGYALLPLQDKATQNVQVYSPTKRPLWYIFSGMGSQWIGMGGDLLRIPVFAASIDRCDKVLRPKGLDIKHIITTDDSSIFNNILNCFVGIAAIQIGLVDILNTLGVTPDGMIGHSVGELGCAYADGCFTAEEMILAAYARGKASLESAVIPGMMAAVGLGYKDMKDRVPPSIDVACHNSAGSCTLSGPTDDIYRYVDQLKGEGVFCKAVSACDIAYHSRYIKTVAPKLLEYLRQIVTNPKPRTSRWISSSVPEDQWNMPDAKLCSAEYHTNNLLNSVYFEEACQHLPQDAILVEIAPHGLLQAILTRAVPSETTNIPLTNRSANSNLNYLLNAIGKLYLNNVRVNVNALYPPVQYPVARNTPSLISMVTWEHDENHHGTIASTAKMLLDMGSRERTVEITSRLPEYKLWKDHCFDNQIVIPVSQLIMYPWKTITDFKRQSLEQSCVVIDNVILGDSVTVDESAGQSLQVLFSRTSFVFSLSLELADSETNKTIVTGRLLEEPSPNILVPDTQLDLEMSPGDLEEVTEQEIYSLLAQYGYNMGPQFQSIKQILIGDSESVAKVQWTGDLITFIDALFKIVVFLQIDEQQVLLQPIYFNKLTINTPVLINLAPDTLVEVHYNYRSNSLVCAGVELLGLLLGPMTHKRSLNLLWSEIKLQPYFDTRLSLEEFLSSCVQMALDVDLGSWKNKSSPVKLLEIRETQDKPSVFSSLLSDTAKVQPFTSSGPLYLNLSKAKEIIGLGGHQSFLVAGEHNHLVALVNSIPNPDSVYCLTYLGNNGSPGHSPALKPILGYLSQAGKLTLLKKVNDHGNVKVFEIGGTNWLSELRQLVAETGKDRTVFVVSRRLAPREVLPILAAESYAYRLRTIFLLDQSAPQFSVTSPFYSPQLALGLPINILTGGAWASLRFATLDVHTRMNDLDFLIQSSQNGLDVACVGLNTNTFTIDPDCDIEEPEIKYLDYSGSQGNQRLMGLAQLNTVYNTLTADPILKWSVPADWTMEDAATVPAIYSLAYYCILLKANVEPGENVLVNAGLSPLAQAVIGITLQVGGNVFASVTSEEEAKSLLKMFPSLKSTHVQILGSQDLAVDFKKLTSGKGVEVIINCVRGRDMQSSIKLMGYDCRFLHLGLIKVEDRASIGMLVFLKRTSFCGVSLDNVANCDDTYKSRLKEALQKGIEQGVVKPFKRSLFPLKYDNQALHHMRTLKATEKTVVVARQEGQLKRKVIGFHCNPDHLTLIAGTRSELWLDVAEWLVRRGARRLVVLTEEERLVDDHVRRFNKLINSRKNTITITSVTRVDTQDSAVNLLKELLRMAMISSVFCICMDENSNRMKNLDLATRELMPKLQNFVLLLGEGTAVSESRAASKLPVVSLQSESPLHTPSSVLPYLSTVLASSLNPTRFLLVRDTVKTTAKNDVLEVKTYLPSSTEEVYNLGFNVSEVPSFSEVVTRSPGYRHTRYSLLPLFVIPGLGPDQLQPLFRQLIHPAFCCTVPAYLQSVDQFAESLLQDVLRIQSHGPYNIVGESWNGAVAFTLGCLLQAKGHQVDLCLVEGAVAATQERVSALNQLYSGDLAAGLLSVILTLPEEAVRKISKLHSWEEKLQLGLRYVPENMNGPVGKALTSLLNQLNALQDFQPPSQLFRGKVTFISQKEVLPSDVSKFLQLCEHAPNVVTTGDENYHQVIANFATATAINENVSFSWK